MGSFYRSRHELIFLFRKPGASHTNRVELGKNGRNRTNVWTYEGMNGFGKGKARARAMHPTVKPLALVRDAILDSSAAGEIVLDLFSGSGTTLIAAEQSKRAGRAMELGPNYVDVGVLRWEGFQRPPSRPGADQRDVPGGRRATPARSRGPRGCDPNPIRPEHRGGPTCLKTNNPSAAAMPIRRRSTGFSRASRATPRVVPRGCAKHGQRDRSVLSSRVDVTKKAAESDRRGEKSSPRNWSSGPCATMTRRSRQCSNWKDRPNFRPPSARLLRPVHHARDFARRGRGHPGGLHRALAGGCVMDASLIPRAVDALCRREFQPFLERGFHTIDPGKLLQRADYLETLCHHLEKVATGEIRRLIVTIPPRHLKSISTAVALPAWMLGRDPTARIICVSYGEDLALAHARNFRALMRTGWYDAVFPG